MPEAAIQPVPCDTLGLLHLLCVSLLAQDHYLLDTFAESPVRKVKPQMHMYSRHTQCLQRCVCVWIVIEV